MAAYQQINTYLDNHYKSMSPEKLILMLYHGALKRLKLAREGIVEKNLSKKGENISKAIAIISELRASVDPSLNDESTQFLRGLYNAILEELPRVNLNSDIKALDRAIKYIDGLKQIWERDVMGRNKTSAPAKASELEAPKAKQSVPRPKQALPGSYGNLGGEIKFQSISV